MLLRLRVDGSDSVNRVVENICDAVDDDVVGDVDVGLGDSGVVDGEIGLGVAGDDDELSGKESREAGAVLEEAEIGEGEALRDDVVRQQERVGDR